MIFIVKDEHNEQRDRVRRQWQVLVQSSSNVFAAYSETRYEHPYEPPKSRGRRYYSK